MAPGFRAAGRPNDPDAAAALVEAAVRRYPDTELVGGVMVYSLGAGWWLGWCSLCNGMVQHTDRNRVMAEAEQHVPSCRARVRTGR